MQERVEYTRAGRKVTVSDKVIDKIMKGVSVVTTKAGDKVNGMTASWFTRVSEDPVLVMISVWKENFSHALIREGGAFAINILADGQKEMGLHFGRQSGRDMDKFQGIEWEGKKTGSPILKDCLGFMDCEVVGSLEAGDHTIFVGNVLEAGFRGKQEPLIYDRRDYPYLSEEEIRKP